MCGRSSLTKTEKDLEARFGVDFYSEDLERYNPIPNYNVAPTHIMPAIISGSRHFYMLRWGLVPFWAKDLTIGNKLINARVESIMDKPSFRHLVQSKRCIIPMDGYYEWKKSGKQKVPYRITTKDQAIFGVAGLWDQWHNSDRGAVINSYTVITIPANEALCPIHERMPAILSRVNEQHWLDISIKPKDAMQLLSPYPSDLMHYYQVSDKVNNVRINEPSLIEKVKGETQPGDQDNDGQQLFLF
ncbi:MAG: SOS response-associated peptidase [Saprospiraceae bacterium]|nr:MAG: putative SOS response-associated peptidase YedK [Bacteroidetes bacterium OLB9]MCO6463204.1 SOS response-associated peptidase [Saprospiraceae bacterium]MCZ2338986.1 SOS response-associated peptidase [Chitinophagales bacterium]